VRYAITTLCQYSIVAIGVLVMFATLGISWSNVQWLVAAISVGLGFGLQEIFANFVSGLIILFERPVRIGDTVTVGEITGTVTRIRIRATTLTDWDNKEIVVPNKTFITNQLTNWTLTDQIVRAVLRVRVAHNSDTELAHNIMLETAQSMPLVLDQPAPTVYFLGLGESSLDFDVRIFVKDLWDWLPAMHEYNMKIEKALREQGVQIPFPQRDIHVRSVTDAAGRPIYDSEKDSGVKPLFEPVQGSRS
jgi:potassium efflux system protein